MKTLKESLFDDNIIKKELTIRDVCALLNNGRGVAAGGASIGCMFDVNKLKKYPKPYNEYALAGINSLDHLIGIIMDQHMPLKSDINVSNGKWCDNLKKELTKYIRRSWRKEWDEKVEIFLIPYSDGKFGVSMDLDHNMGFYEFIFEPKS